MKILFIVPATGYYRSTLSNPLGVLSIATCLKKNGYDVKIFDRNVEKANVKKMIASFNPDVVGMSVMSSRCLKDALKISEFVKKKCNVLVWGGQLPTMNTELCFQCEQIDYIIMGEGEITWNEFAEKIRNSGNPYNIDGIAYKKNNQITVTKCRNFANLAEFPDLDYSLINTNNYFMKYYHCDKMVYLYSSKGCPCNCSFCGNMEYHRCTHRKRPVGQVVREIKYLIENNGIDGVFFSDELWCDKKADATEFCMMIMKDKLKFAWGINARIGQYSRENFQILYDANCRFIFFGVESGSESILKKMHKGISIDEAEDNINVCIEIGFTVIANFILGFPGETVEDVQNSVNLAMRVSAKLISVHYFFPTPGSDLQRDLIESNHYKPFKTLKEFGKAIPTIMLIKNFSEVPSKDLIVIRCFFYWVALTRKNTVSNKGVFELARQVFSNMFRLVSKKGVRFIFIGALSSASELLYVIWHVAAYPIIRKKYGLYTKDKK